MVVGIKAPSRSASARLVLSVIFTGIVEGLKESLQEMSSLNSEAICDFYNFILSAGTLVMPSRN